MERLPKKNLTAKIIALIMAVILWVYVMNEQNPPVETSMEIPLEVRNLSSSVMAVDIPEFVRVKVRGPRTLIVALTPKDIKSYVDLKGLPDGRNSVKVTTAIPASMEIVEVSPEKINCRLDTITTRKVPVEVKIVGKVPATAVLGKINYSATTATVKGPTELLDTMAKVVTQVDVSGKTTDFTVTMPLSILDEKGKTIDGLSVNPGNVSVSIAIVPVINKKVVDIKPNVVGIVHKDVTLKKIAIEPLQVEISGETKDLEKTEVINTEPIVITDIDKDTAMEVKLQVKDGIAITKNTVMVTISVEKKPPVKGSD